MNKHETQTAPLAGGPSSPVLLEAVGSGWLLAIKAATDQGSAIWFAVKEAIAEKKASNDDLRGRR